MTDCLTLTQLAEYCAQSTRMHVFTVQRLQSSKQAYHQQVQVMLACVHSSVYRSSVRYVAPFIVWSGSRDAKRPGTSWHRAIFKSCAFSCDLISGLVAEA